MDYILKVVRKGGKTKVESGVAGIEYGINDEGIEIDVKVADTSSNVQHDYFIETIQLRQGDSAYLVNDHGCTVDVVRVK